MNKISFLVMSILFTSLITFAQSAKENITASFFKEFEKDPLQAHNNLFSSNKWMKDKKSELETLKIKLKDLIDQLGEYYGYELLAEKKAGESYILKSFIVKYERQPVRFTFILYNPHKEWQIQNFTFDVNVDDELTEAAKADRLKENW